MKSLFEDDIDKLFHNELHDYERTAPSQPLVTALDRLAIRRNLGRLVACAIAVIMGIVGYITYTEILNQDFNIAEEIVHAQNESETEPIQSEEKSVELTLDNNEEKSSRSNNLSYPSQAESHPLIDQNDSRFTEEAETSNLMIQEASIELDEDFVVVDGIDRKEPPKSSLLNHMTIDFTRVDNPVVPNKSHKRKGALYAQVTPFLLYNIVNPNKNDEFLVHNFEAEDALSINRIGLRAALSYDHELTNKLSISTGVSLFYKKVSYSYNTTSYIQDSTNTTTQAIPGVGFEIISNNVDTLRTTDNLAWSSTNIGFYLGLIYRFNARHKIGLSYEYQRNVGLSFQETSEDYDPLNKNFVYLEYIMEYPLGKRIYFNLRPTISYTLRNVSSLNPIDIKPYGLGLGFGIKYHLH